MAENQLINELLCFLVNKLECMPADLLVKLICDFYDDKEIDAARECLFSLLPVSASAQRKVRRKGANKKSMTVQDMLHILLNTEVDDIPCFVARDLARLPPLTQDHFDLATVMRDVVNIRNDVASLLTLKDDVKTLSSQVFDIVALGKTTAKRPSSEAESPAETCPDLPLTNASTADIIRESLDNYMQILAEISAIIQNCSTHEVVIMGDFNADFKRRFGQELRTFANENELHISDGILHGFDSDFYTYISEASFSEVFLWA